MDLRTIFQVAVNPALALLPSKMDSAGGRILVGATGLQESRFEHRFQVVQGQPGVKGPARGFWQFERGGGVRGVLTHPASREHAYRLCESRGIQTTAIAAYEAIETDDVLAAVFARLLLWTDGWRLPAPGDMQGGWDLYLRTWRPGAYDRGTQEARVKLRAKWSANYAQAMAEVER